MGNAITNQKSVSEDEGQSRDTADQGEAISKCEAVQQDLTEILTSVPNEVRIFLKLQINDKPLRFMIDTGATFTAIDSSYVDKKHLNSSEYHTGSLRTVTSRRSLTWRSVNLKASSLDGHSFGNVTFNVFDFSLSFFKSQRLAGVLGMDFLVKTQAEISYLTDRPNLIFSVDSAITNKQPVSDDQICNCNKYEQVYIKLHINAKPLWFKIDTGATKTVLKMSHVDKKLLNTTKKRRFMFMDYTGSCSESAGAVDLEVSSPDGHSFGTVTFGVCDMMSYSDESQQAAGILGADFLVKAKAELSFRRNVINLKDSKNYSRDYNLYRMSQF